MRVRARVARRPHLTAPLRRTLRPHTYSDTLNRPAYSIPSARANRRRSRFAAPAAITHLLVGVPPLCFSSLILLALSGSPIPAEPSSGPGRVPLRGRSARKPPPPPSASKIREPLSLDRHDANDQNHDFSRLRENIMHFLVGLPPFVPVCVSATAALLPPGRLPRRSDR